MYALANNNPILYAKRMLVAHAADQISINGAIDANTIQGKKSILHAVLINNIVQEGIFFYSAFAMFFAMRDSGKMKNVCNGVDLVLIDESLHLKTGMEIIFTMLEETPEILDDADFINTIQQTIVQAVSLELQFLGQQFETGITFGLAYKEMELYLHYIADRRLEELGFGTYYGVSENPLKFLEKQDVTTLQNFFEVTPNQYTNY
jgi:ribonucleoside-diphosphate reductase beta chain